ncbi:MAG: tyrosine-type recombinase/integrase [Magnetococcales bacterium]|nr:tyrosine-type recombinase/integrase [Magnetococcales bacterium]
MKLTKRTIDSLTPTEKRAEYSDDVLKGFIIRVYPSGRKSFMIRYRMGNASKRYAIGDYGKWTVGQARKEAMELLRLASKGEDPSQARRRSREALTFSQLAEKYLEARADSKRTIYDDRNKLDLRLIPAWGKRPINLITSRHVRQVITKLKADGRAVATCNRYLALIRVMFNFAIREGLLEDNPAATIKVEQENNKRTRWLDADELNRLFQALEEYGSPTATAALAMMLYTGARSGNVLSASWDDIDMERRQWTIPRTKAGKAQVVPLNDAAMGVLENQEKVMVSRYVFPGQKPWAHLTTVKKPWAAATKRAGIKDARIHDLRHTFASMVVNSGAELYHVQQLLGHATGAMTQRYAHIKDEVLRKASGSVAEVVNLDSFRLEKQAG